MSPRAALRILLFVAFFLFVFMFAMYKIQLEYSSMTLGDIEHQAEMERRINEANELLGDNQDARTLQERSDQLIRDDLRIHNSVQPETVQEIIDMANREIRIMNGLPVD
jgi:uncharacterized membrane protein affecting hemolysin expression